MKPLKAIHQVAKEIGVAKQLHLWPDKSLGSGWVVQSMPKPDAYAKWLLGLWSKISVWPTTEPYAT
jgi:hypothetical protein